MAALPGNLDGTRVLDLTREPGFFAGKLLGDLGADVVKVEPPGGDPARRRPPFWGGIADPERSLLWLAMNTSKRGVTLDLARPRGRALFLELAARADAVLATEPTPGLGWPELRAQNPRLVHVALTPFGETGPRAGWRGSDLTVTATSGNLYSTGDPDRAPVPSCGRSGASRAGSGRARAALCPSRCAAARPASRGSSPWSNSWTSTALHPRRSGRGA